MSVVIIGGHTCMTCRYAAICKKYRCKPKIYTHAERNFEERIGKPDLIILFTSLVSHSMAKIVKKKAALQNIAIVQSHCGSGESLKNILSAELSPTKNAA